MVPGEEKDISHTPWFGDERAKKQIYQFSKPEP
jgi:hypothetical protein